ncbi:MAG: hypothetical protein L0Z54_05295 [Thermoplasmata archaeon]|nr:hypothetical protein [Thermoplasmata archaeon]
MRSDRILVAIEASHSMSAERDGRTRFEDALLYARDLAEQPVIFGFNSDWFIIEESEDGGTPLEMKGSGLIAAAFRGGRELSRQHGIGRMIIFTDGPDEAVLPRKEAEECTAIGLAVDIVLVAGSRKLLASLDELASAAGGRAILLDKPPEEDTEDVPVKAVVPRAAVAGMPTVEAKDKGAPEEAVISVAPKEAPVPPTEDGVKGIFHRIKDKVW